jgi:hypothetical protein
MQRRRMQQCQNGRPGCTVATERSLRYDRFQVGLYYVSFVNFKVVLIWTMNLKIATLEYEERQVRQFNSRNGCSVSLGC